MAATELSSQAQRYTRQKRQMAKYQLGLPEDLATEEQPDTRSLAEGASDPNTPGSRLEELYRNEQSSTQLRLLLLGHPSLPPDLLRGLLTHQSLELFEARLAVVDTSQHGDGVSVGDLGVWVMSTFRPIQPCIAPETSRTGAPRARAAR